MDRIALGALALVLIVRIAYPAQALLRAPVLRQPLADSRSYVDWARSIAAGHGGDAAPFYRAPLYPYLIAPLYAARDHPEAAIAVLQVLLGVVLVALTWRIARRMYGARAGLVSLVLLGFYGPIAAQETKILATSVGLVLGMVGLARILAARGIRGHIVAGFLLGLGALVRPDSLVLAVGAIAIVALAGGERPVRGLRPAAALAAGLVLAIAPVTARNLAAGDLVLISSNGGMTFFHGNNEESRDGLIEPPARIGAYGNAVEQEVLDRQLASQEVGRPLQPSESSAHWWGEGIRYLTGHPKLWARLWGVKIVRFAGAHDYADNYAYAVERAGIPLLRLFWVPFPLILIAGIAGLFLRGPRGRDEALIVLFAGLGLLTCVLFYVGSRYRSESVPAMAILAGRGAAALWTGGGGTRRRWAAAAVSTVMIAIALVPPGAPAASQDALAAAQWAAALERDHRPEEAFRFYRWGAERYGPLDVNWARWADFERAAHGDSAGAAILDRGIAAGADGRMLRTHRGLMRGKAGREEEAESDYRRALQFAPDDPSAALNLAVLLVRRGADRDATPLLALPELRENPDALYLRAVIAARENRMSDVVGLIDSSLAAGNRDPRAGLLRALAWTQLSMPDEATSWVRDYLLGLGVAQGDLDLETERIVDALGPAPIAQPGAPPVGALARAWEAVRAVREAIAPPQSR